MKGSREGIDGGTKGKKGKGDGGIWRGRERVGRVMEVSMEKD